VLGTIPQYTVSLSLGFCDTLILTTSSSAIFSLFLLILRKEYYGPHKGRQQENFQNLKSLTQHSWVPWQHKNIIKLDF
jgi:hypothetical protein